MEAPSTPAGITFKGKTYVLPQFNSEALLRAVMDRLKAQHVDPMDLVIKRYDELKNKPAVLDKLLEKALRPDQDAPSKAEVSEFMASFDGQVWTLWWMLHGQYPELTMAEAEELLIYDATTGAELRRQAAAAREATT